MNVAQALQAALARHQAGDLDAAEKMYRDILKKQPKQADAHNLLGVLLHQKGQFAAAIQHTQRACDLDPRFHVPHVNLGNALQAAGRPAEAVAAFRRALALKPAQAEILSNLASALNATGAYDEALAAAAEAMRANPNLGEAYNNEGNALLGLGRAAEALVSFERAQALGAPPFDVFFNIAEARLALGQADLARDILARLLQANPDDARLWFGRGNAAMALDDFTAAEQAFSRALALDPGHTGARCNLAAAHQSMGDTARAVADLEAAVAAEPEAPDLRWNLSLARLQAGDYAAAWGDHEARWDMPAFQALRRTWVKPNWDGGDLSGKTILVRAEQGFGDALRMARFLPLLAARAARVIVECRPPLSRLFAALPGVDEAFDLGAALPDHDLQIPVMSLPGRFGVTRDSLPAGPYLKVPADAAAPDAVARAPGLKVGLAWAGSPTRAGASRRDIPFALLAGLLDVPGVSFFSLQMGAFRDDLAPGLPVTDLAEGIGDFADTAAAVAALDLVICVDTALLHVAGGLGRPVWGLMSRPTGYYWGTDGETDPWYPTARLYRQPAPVDWAGVIARVRDDLEKLSN